MRFQDRCLRGFQLVLSKESVYHPTRVTLTAQHLEGGGAYLKASFQQSRHRCSQSELRFFHPVSPPLILSILTFQKFGSS
jgi:hypothetical protein